jgi:hypothetical protein
MGKIDFLLFSDSIDAYFKVLPPIAVLLDKHLTRALSHYLLHPVRLVLYINQILFLGTPEGPAFPSLLQRNWKDIRCGKYPDIADCPCGWDSG